VVGLLKVIRHKPSLGLHRSRRETRARERCSDVGAVFCVFSLEFTRQAERIVQRCSRRTLEHPKCGAPTAAVPHSAFDGMLRLEAGGGVQLACGSLSPPCRAKLSEVGSASWLASQSALPAAHIICARTWGGTTRSQYTVPRKLRPPLDMPIRALRQQAATYGSEWPRESGAHPWRVPTHSGFTRPRSGMKGPDWGLAGAGTTVKRPPFESLVFCPSHFRTVTSAAQRRSVRPGPVVDSGRGEAAL